VLFDPRVAADDGDLVLLQASKSLHENVKKTSGDPNANPLLLKFVRHFGGRVLLLCSSAAVCAAEDDEVLGVAVAIRPLARFLS
jgi:hypothetical protein